MGEKQYPEEGQLEICPSENTQYYTEIGDQVIKKQIVIQVQSAGAPQQPQPAQPQP